MGIKYALLKKEVIFSKLFKNWAIKKEIIISNGIATTVKIIVFFSAYRNDLFLKIAM